MSSDNRALSSLPKVDRVLADPALAEVTRLLGARALTAVVREVLSDARRRARAGGELPAPGTVVAAVEAMARQRIQSPICPVINATGVLLHTNLGRAPLSLESLARVAAICRGYSSLELDVAMGVRTRRGLSLESRLAQLVGAEDALIVNNNAAAVLLALSATCAGRQVLVSRGELLEIGGGFRIPDVLARSGSRLVEVGTTNRTRTQDYERAMNPEVGGILRVHPSNFEMTGFSSRPSLSELSAFARRSGVPLIKDLGGGLVVPLPETIAARDRLREPLVQTCLRDGADLVCFSLDKLFGGPQGGVIVGSAALVGRLREDPLARALRVDKITLAALEPVVDAYARDDLDGVPLWAMLRASLPALTERAERCRVALGAAGANVAVAPTAAAIGGGTLAEATFPSVGLVLVTRSAEALAAALRQGTPAVLARIEDGRVVLDLRTVAPAEDAALVGALESALRSND